MMNVHPVVLGVQKSNNLTDAQMRDLLIDFIMGLQLAGHISGVGGMLSSYLEAASPGGSRDSRILEAVKEYKKRG